ncbi:MAG: amidohydrolase [Candidatus Glassbacteria bacterium]|nr:amidohydrolase [Candidatus Glassbacteria bacterium]
MDAASVRDDCLTMNERIVAWRRDLHRIPEIGIELPDTENYVRQRLAEFGVPLQAGYDGTGVVALVEGTAGRGPVLAVRADMDALEIEEATGAEYSSTRPGRMHACGHDAHTAIALGAAEYLIRHRDKLAGTVKFIFQPGEECMDGARRMIEAGALENPRVEAVIGLHIGGIWNELGTGQVGVSDRAVMAAADAFNFSMKAVGSHGAYPHQSADPVLAASAAVVQLHTLVGRSIRPTAAAVVTVGRIEGGQARNIIPTEVAARGTVRTLDQAVRDHLRGRIGEVIAGVAAAHGCSHSYEFFPGAPAVIGDSVICGRVRDAAVEILGRDDVVEITEPSLGGEDVSLFMERAPGCFFGLGGSNPAEGIHSIHHNPEFRIDESVLWRGAAVFSLCALRRLAPSG